MSGINNFKEILEQIKLLENKELSYIAGDKKIEIKEVDYEKEKIVVKRNSDIVGVSFDRMKFILKRASNGKPIHIDTAFQSSGNDRTIIETILTYLPNFGFMKANHGRNKTKYKMIQWFPQEIHSIGESLDVSDMYYHSIAVIDKALLLPKPFILLAGISGTGKTRFVREQAKASASIFGIPENSNYSLVPVRPDWHEPSDLLGYISHINGTRYHSTPFLIFLVKALAAATEYASETEIIWKDPGSVPPYWLCLDEMNLAPVEQYFADYLSVIESRKWENGIYTCHPLLNAAQFNNENSVAAYSSLLRARS